MKLALLHNPRSGYNRRHPRSVPAAAAQAGVPCWQVSSMDELMPAMQAIAGTAPDVLIVNGGDGTVDAVVTCLRRSGRFAAEPALAILPGGSTNMIARDVGCAGRPEEAVRRLAGAARAGEPGEMRRRAPFAVCAAGVPGPLGFFFAGGALPLLLRRPQRKAQARGVVGRGGAALALLQTTLRLVAGNLREDPGLRPRGVSWSVGAGEGAAPEREELVLYFVTTLDRMVMGIRPGQARPGLRFLALRYPYRNIIGSVARLVRGRPFHHPDENLLFRAGERIQLEFEGEAVLDGESLPLQPGPAALDLVLDAPLAFWQVRAR